MKKITFYLLLFVLFPVITLSAQVDDDVEKNIAKFWDYVKSNESKFFDDKLSENEDYKLLREHIAAVNENIDAVVMVNRVDKKRRFIVTSYGDEEYFKLIEELVKKAPDLKYLKPFALFPAIPDIIPFTIDGKALELKDIKVHYDAPVNGQYDILLLLPEEHRVNMTYEEGIQYYNAYRSIVYKYMIQLFGERTLVKKIHSFDLYKVNVAIDDISLLDFNKILQKEK